MKKGLVSRRQVLTGGAALAVPALAVPALAPAVVGCGGALDGEGDSEVASDESELSARPPTSTAGVVIEVSDRRAVVAGQVQSSAVRRMVSRGMRGLTRTRTDRDAWRALFTRTDVVGIKVSPVGYPEVFSHVEVVAELIRGLALVGIPHTNVVVFDRYRDYLDKIGYPARLPKGVRFAGVVDTYTEDQTGQAGYDPAAYVDIARVYPGDDPKDPAKRRSCLCQLVSQRLTKVINVPALKDHVSAGVTFALKNSTYGLVNNVSRTHVAPANWTKDFVPAVAAMKGLRDKLVLHVGDALVACYDGGPGPPDPNFKTFEHGALFFATDPVALDRVGWSLLDARRAEAGLPPLAACGLDLENRGLEAFGRRQPQHVLAAGAAGLGVADLARIQHERIAI